MKKKQKMSKKGKIILFAALAAVAVALAFGLNYLFTFLNYEKDVEQIAVQEVDLSTIADGEYFGDCNVDFVSAKVRVLIRDHTIIEVELLEHINDRGAAADAMPDKIVSEQRIGVDAVSGATSSSKVIQEAVYNALTGERTIRR